MKYLIILLFITNSFASTLFWDNVDKIKNEFYHLDSQIDDNKLSDILDKKYISFNELIIILKNRPYDVKINNKFKSENITSKIKLEDKIKINKKYAYDLAVLRDEIQLLNLVLEENIHKYFLNISNKWTTFDKNSLDNINKKYYSYLETVNYDNYLASYNKLKPISGDVKNKIKENLEELHKNYKFFSEVLVYIKLNNNLLSYKSLATFLKLDTIIKEINLNPNFTKINPYLRFVHIDMGKLILFILIIFVFLGLNYFVYKIIYNYIKTILEKNHDEIDDNILDNTNKIRKPVSLILLLIGLKLAFEVLSYPNNLNEQIVNIFYFIYLTIFTYIIFIIIDVFLFVYLVKKETETETIRKELIIFLTSIFKVTIFFVIFIFFLIQIDVNISAILASLGIGGLAVALAAQTTLSNFFGLLKMIFDNSFSQSDWIETQDIEGHVVDISFISTTIRTFDNALITIPNSTLANSSIKNWSKRKVGRRIKMNIGVTYSSSKENLQNAIKQIEQMLINHHGIATSEELDYDVIHKNYKKEQKFVSINDKYGVKSTLFVYLDKLSDSSMDILIYAFTKTTNWKEWLEIKQDIIFSIWEIMENNNLEFAFPSQSIYLENNQKEN